MANQRVDLGRLLDEHYLDELESKTLEEIRAMRAECQEAEVGLSYLRRLAQGRLDIIHRALEREGAPSGEDLSSLVGELPGILSAGPGRPPGPGRLPMLLAPDTEHTELTAELDEAFDVAELGQLGDDTEERLRQASTRVTEIERRVSDDRRRLHERIDTLQAEIVSRYKTGRASVDGLLS